MLRTLPLTRNYTETQRLIGIIVFAVLAIISAKIEIPRDPVPFTMQPFIVLLAGMVLGARDGALSLGLYVGLIALGFPFDANGRGTAALVGPTGGYLIGFIAAAGVVGLIVEHGKDRFWQRLLAGIVGVAVIYAFGVTFLKNVLDIDSWKAAWDLGGEPFLGLDLIKAIIAAGLAESTRRLLLRSLTPPEIQ